MNEILKTCPKCGRIVKVLGGPEEWVPTFYDPDSGGEPYHIHCECGISFCIGYCEYNEFVELWNRRTSNERGMTAKEALEIGKEISKGIQAGIDQVNAEISGRKKG